MNVRKIENIMSQDLQRSPWLLHNHTTQWAVQYFLAH